MRINYEALKAWPFGEIQHEYGPKDVMLYALALGIGWNPTDPRQLRFVYEDGLQVLPGFALVMGYPGVWVSQPGTGLDWRKVLNVEQGVELLAPLPVRGPVLARNLVEEVVDKGLGKGALLYTSRELLDSGGKLLARVTQTILCRGDGGFGGPVTQARPDLEPLPQSRPTHCFDHPTPAQAALIFRLSGDTNPLHADPTVARAAGFDRPILHGAALFGIAAYAIVQAACAGEAVRLRDLRGRFSAPVFPGETIRTELWIESSRIRLRCVALERSVVVLDRGIAVLAPE